MTVLLWSYVSFAKVVPLVSIVEKDTGNVTNLTLYTNNLGHIEKLRVKSIIRSQWVKKSELSGNGKTLFSKMGVSIITLKSHNMDEKFGGDVIIDYLAEYNLFSSNVRKQLQMQLVKSKERWILKYRNRKVSKIIVTPHSKGIESLRVVSSRIKELNDINL